MARRRRRNKVPDQAVEIIIESLSHEGRGVGHIEGKTTFVDNALIGETILMKYHSVRGRFDEGHMIEVKSAAPERVEPICRFYDICGGCSLQHMSSQAQIAFKQEILAEQFLHFGQVEPVQWLEPLQKDTYGYRSKARLGVRYVAKKGGCLVGFREKRSGFLADIESCSVLDPRVSELLMPLRNLITQMEARASTPQIELATSHSQIAFIIRHMEPLSESDQNLWINFAQQHSIDLYFQPKGPDTIHKVWPADEIERLTYKHPKFGLEMKFHPTDFTQVNTSINESMVGLAVELLDLNPSDRVLDLFCGLGNFTLPLATKSGLVVGVEGSSAMVERGYENAKHNKISNVEFYAADLQKDFSDKSWAKEGFNKILIDPPRSGAEDVVSYIDNFNADKIVYVSCNPATLARDAGILKDKGYKLLKAGVMDMFPHTAHVESIAVFEKQ